MKKSDLHGLRIFQCCNTSSQPGQTKQFEFESDSDSQVVFTRLLSHILSMVGGWYKTGGRTDQQRREILSFDNRQTQSRPFCLTKIQRHTRWRSFCQRQTRWRYFVWQKYKDRNNEDHFSYKDLRDKDHFVSQTYKDKHNADQFVLQALLNRCFIVE